MQHLFKQITGGSRNSNTPQYSFLSVLTFNTSQYSGTVLVTSYYRSCQIWLNEDTTRRNTSLQLNI